MSISLGRPATDGGGRGRGPRSAPVRSGEDRTSPPANHKKGGGTFAGPGPFPGEGGPSAPLKIVHVTLRFDAPGGVETTVREIARRLVHGGDEVEVFASDLLEESGWKRGREFRPVVDGVPVRRFAALRRPFLPPERSARGPGGFSLPVLSGLVEALRESRADVIHAHSHRYGHVLQAAAAARKSGIPLVVSTHYHPADRREPRWKKGLLRCEDFAFGLTAYRTARTLVTESQREAGEIGRFAPRDRIRVIPPGIDLAQWRDPAEDRAGALGLPDRYLLFVGRIASNKGLPFLFEAFARLPRPERPTLVLMGPDWGERASLEAQARRRGIEADVRWLGPVPEPAAYRGVVRGAQALVLPSEWEAYGLVLLDAMAAGTPIVATDVGAVGEVLDHGRVGRLVPYGDPAGLEAALREALEEPGTTRDRAARARERVQRFDWSVAVEGHRAMYRELAEH